MIENIERRQIRIARYQIQVTGFFSCGYEIGDKIFSVDGTHAAFDIGKVEESPVVC